MAFSFSNAASGGGGFGPPQPNGGIQGREGPELEEIQTDELGFLAINGESQVQLLPTPWPIEALPAPTSSLLAVASTKGLIAAAGPDSLVITSTDSVRQAFRSQPPAEENKVRPMSPQLTIPLSRVTQLAFSSDESVLVVSSEEGGGLTAFQTDSLKNGLTTPALQISTDGTSLRALVPNPAAESAAFFAAVTLKGDLLLADFQAGHLASGASGSVLKGGVSCVSWSNKGKQLVAGLADGTATQMKPDGTVVAMIPKSTSIPAECHVSGIVWLENDSFLIIYTPNDTSDGIQPSEYYIVNREPKTTNYVFQKLPEVLAPFGVERTPSFHFITRLRHFPPHIQDLLLLTATTATDVGLVSKTDKPLSQETNVTGNFTYTTISDDRRRAQLPLNTNMLDTSPIGMALDLSTRERVLNPIPSDVEIIETDGPVPNLLVLNNDGILLSWWIIYNDSIREKTLFSGFASLSTDPTSQVQTLVHSEPSPPAHNVLAPPSSTFGQSSFGGASVFGKPAASTFASTSAQSGFGNSSSNVFGTSSTIGGDKSSWTSTGFGGDSSDQTGSSSFGQPAFGSAASMGANSAPAFGSASALGSRPGAYGQPAPSSAQAFGKPTAFGAQAPASGNMSSSSPFGAPASGTSTSSGFASFSQKGGFGGFGSTTKTESAGSSFGRASGDSIFGKTSSESIFAGKKDTASGFGGAANQEKPSIFGGIDNFKLGSTFKGDGTAKDDLPKGKTPSSFEFGTGFNNILGEPKAMLSPTHDKEANMDDEEVRDGSSTQDNEAEMSDDETRDQRTNLPDKPADSPVSGFAAENSKKPPQTLITPPATFVQSKTTPAPPVSTLFGSMDQQSTTPQPQTSTPAWAFGGVPSTTPKETPAPSHTTIFGTTTQFGDTPAAVQKSESTSAFGKLPEGTAKDSSEWETPAIKQEPPSDDDSAGLDKIPEAPLPPDPTSKPRYVSGDTSESSNNSKSFPEDAPLPPDFMPANKSADVGAEQHGPPTDDDEEEEFSSDFEGSGEDVSGEISPIEERNDEHEEQVQTSPESSFKSGERSAGTSPTGGLFTKVSTTTNQKSIRPLFGEVGSGPIFPPPKPQQSPRSPSPVRNLMPVDTLRAESARSVSAPARPRSVIDQRKTEYSQSALANQAARAKEEQAAKEKALQAELARRKAQAEAEQLENLEDDEDQQLQRELASPVIPRETLDAFITYQPNASEDTSKSGIPAQIERLYRDINSMVDTLGINARSLSAFIEYQQDKNTNDSWPSVLESETPLDALNDEWVLVDVFRLHEGDAALQSILEESKVHDVAGKLQSSQYLLGHDLFELRTKLTSIRKSLHARSNTDGSIAAPLSAEQASIQHDLRKASASVQTKLVQVEDQLSVLRARLAGVSPPELSGKRQSMLGRTMSQKKPTIEAVTSTIAKMTSMAEKKSADIDVLEARLKKLNFGASANGNRSGSTEPNGTPERRSGPSLGTSTGSAAKSVYHTPDSKFSGSVRSTPGNKSNTTGVVVSVEDRERWEAKARRKKEAASILKGVLEERRKRAAVKI